MKPLFKTKRALLSTILALVLVIGVGATLAYLSAADARLTNTFSLAEVDTEIKEDLTDGNKTVTVKNVGKSPVYIRARLMVSGIDPANVIVSDDKQYDAENATAPKGKVVLYMPNVTTDWQQADNSKPDNFYYYKGVVYGGAEDATPKENPTETSALLKKVVFADDLAKNKDFLDQFSVTVYHESVLAQDTSLKDASAIEDVFNTAKTTP